MTQNPFSAPDPEGVCCVEGCDNEATESWFPDHCALREGGVKPEWKHICTEHDLALNKFVTNMFYGDKYDQLLDEYVERKRAYEQMVKAAEAHGFTVVELP